MGINIGELKEYEHIAKAVIRTAQNPAMYGPGESWIPVAAALKEAESNQVDWNADAWMETFTGKRFYPLKPNIEDIEILDIAQALSMLCRYNGHCINFYSVAEHSILLSQQIEKAFPDKPEWAKIALLHDATEGYLADIVRPVKPYLSNYALIEDNLWRVIARRYKLPEDMPSQVKNFDVRMCLDEREQNMFPSGYTWNIPGEKVGVTLQFMTPPLARASFITRFYQLFGKDFV